MGAGASTLSLVQVAGAGHAGLAQNGSGASHLGQAHASVYVSRPYGGPNKLVQVSGEITATGGGIFQFSGKPNVGVIWSITVGSGSINAQSATTDDFGNSFAVYQAGGYEGELTVEVAYGS